MRRLAPLWLVALPLLLNATAIGGWLSADPLPAVSFLALQADPGLLPGSAGWTDPNVGMTTQALGHLAASDWLAGVPPWWNPYTGLGMPLAAQMQPSALFLPFSLLLALADGVLWLKLAMQVLAGLGTFALLRELGAGRTGALAAGVLFGLNGSFGWYGGYAPCLPVAFLPLFLLGIERAAAAARAGRRGGWGLLAVAEAYSILAGFPETAFLDGLLAMGWALLRIFELPQGQGGALLRKVALGGVLGLLLAAPAWVGFLGALRQGSLGQRLPGSMADFDLPARFAAILLFPHMFGLPSGFLAEDGSGTIYELFARNGGWLGLVMSVLALLGLLHRPGQVGLRLLLGVWLVLGLGKTLGLPGVAFLMNLIPGMPDMSFPRYGPPGWEMAAAVLAGLALDDWRRGRAAGPRALALAVVAVLGASAAAVHAAVPVLRTLRGEVADYALWPAVSVAGAASLLLPVAAAWRLRPSGFAAVLLVVLATAEASGLYFVPMLAGLRNVRLDLDTVAFLQDHLGLQRFLTYGPLQPNYGAYFGIAGLNHEVIPVPEPWAGYMTAHIDPRPLVTEFASGYPPAGALPRAAELRARIPAYQEAGVRYVLSGAAETPFADPPPWDAVLQPDGGMPLALGPGQAAGGTLRAGRDGRLVGAAVTIGTYLGAASGRLDMTLCRDDICTAGTAELQGAADNAPFAVRFSALLPVRAGDTLRWRIAHAPGGTAVALWLWPDRPGVAPSDTQGPAGPVAGGPRLTPDYDTPPEGPRLVHRSAIAAIWELPEPQPYFDAAGCKLAVRDREHLHAACPAAATLLRRELFYPGWQASVDGVPVSLARAAEVFQAIELPAGDSEVRFSYRPPFLTACLAAFGLGLLGLAAGAWRGRRA